MMKGMDDMAKYERELTGSFNDLLAQIHADVTGRSATASFEGGSDYQSNGIRLAVRVYERYSMIGKNRVSLNITLLGKDDKLFLSAITSGGSQAMFFKINVFGEQNFLDLCIKSVERYASRNG